jgi:hypothetical protein
MYAGGIEVPVDVERGIINVAVTETLYGMPYAMAEIRGQDGTLLKTTSHYLAFARQFEEIAKKNANRPEPIRLINASVGGAYLEGFQHQSLQESFAGQQLEPILKDTFFLPEDLTQKIRLFQKGLSSLVKGLEATLEQAKHIQKAAQAMAALPANQWGQHGQSFSSARESFEKLLQEQPFIEYALMVETLDFKQKAPKAQSTAEQLRMTADYYEACVRNLRDHLLPWAREAQKHFQECHPEVLQSISLR